MTRIWCHGPGLVPVMRLAERAGLLVGVGRDGQVRFPANQDRTPAGAGPFLPAASDLCLCPATAGCGSLQA
jgi:hypothetical protein